MPQLSDVFKQATELADSKRPLAAIEKLEWLSERLLDPAALTLVRYNCGCLFRSAVGNGVRARTCFIQASEQAAKVAVLQDTTKILWSNACENLMLLSLSYEDYTHWADELRRLHPTADILRGQVPWIIGLRDRGLSWSNAMAGMAEGFYSRSDPQHDPGMYGDAASLFQLLVTHRKELRLGREDWKRAINEYGRLCLRLCGDTAVAAEKKNPTADPREAVPIVTDALPLVDEYLKANPGDDAIKEMRRSMQEGARELSEARAPAPVLEPEDVFDAMAPGEFVSARMRCPKCGQKVNGPVFKCSNCGHQFVSLGVTFLKGLVTGLLVFTALRYGVPSAPRWVAPLAGFLLGNLVFVITTAKAAVQQQLGEPTVPKSAALQRQERIDDIMGWQRPREVRCRNGHLMNSFEDEGVLLAVCPTCGIVKPYPGTMALMTDLNRVAAKYDNFDF